MSERKVKSLDNAPTDVGMELDTFETWFIANWKKIIASAVVILVVIALTSLGMSLKRASDAKTEKMLAGAATIDEITRALGESPSGALACETRARLAKLHLQKKDYKSALREYSLIAADPSANAYTRGRAILDSGYICELENKYKEAITFFERAAGDHSLTKGAVAEGYYGAGRLYAAQKDYQKARKALNAAVRQGNSSMWSALASSCLSTLPAEEVKAPAKADAKPAKKAEVKKAPAKADAKPAKKAEVKKAPAKANAKSAAEK